MHAGKTKRPLPETLDLNSEEDASEGTQGDEFRDAVYDQEARAYSQLLSDEYKTVEADEVDSDMCSSQTGDSHQDYESGDDGTESEATSSQGTQAERLLDKEQSQARGCDDDALHDSEDSGPSDAANSLHATPRLPPTLSGQRQISASSVLQSRCDPASIKSLLLRMSGCSLGTVHTPCVARAENEVVLNQPHQLEPLQHQR